MLDMDSSESPVHGRQEGSAGDWNALLLSQNDRQQAEGRRVAFCDGGDGECRPERRLVGVSCG